MIGSIAILLSATSVMAQNLSQAERDFLVNHLEKTRADVEKATKGLSSAQWNFKPGVFKWSVAECVEHIALAEDFIFNIITTRVMKSPGPATPKDPAELSKADQNVINVIVDRSARVQAPDPVRPKKQASTTPDQSLSRFFAGRGRTVDFAKTNQELRGHCMDGPIAKCTDAYQWLLFLSAHTQRHTNQLLEVKADPKFPKE
jgi:hypothetical protein